jgi:hypothetical protein
VVIELRGLDLNSTLATPISEFTVLRLIAIADLVDEQLELNGRYI